MTDIQDRWEAGIIPHGYKKSATMTDQELSNRLKSIWALDCIESEYREYNWGDDRKDRSTLEWPTKKSLGSTSPLLRRLERHSCEL